MVGWSYPVEWTEEGGSARGTDGRMNGDGRTLIRKKRKVDVEEYSLDNLRWRLLLVVLKRVLSFGGKLKPMGDSWQAKC